MTPALDPRRDRVHLHFPRGSGSRGTRLAGAAIITGPIAAVVAGDGLPALVTYHGGGQAGTRWNEVDR